MTNSSSPITLQTHQFLLLLTGVACGAAILGAEAAVSEHEFVLI